MSRKDQSGFDIPDVVKARTAIYKGLPFVGESYTVDEDSKPVAGRKVHIRQFNLSLPEDMAEYVRIFQDRADEKNTISFEEKVYDADIKSWRVLLRWFDHIFTAPPKKKEGKVL